MHQYYEGLAYICNLATPTTSPIRPLNLDPWPCALWVVKSQFALHHGSEFQWSVFHTGRAPLCFSHTLTHWKHRADSAALLAPCLPPGPPLALFMKARPLSAALSAPSLYGADYSHPESTSFTFSFSLSLSVHPISAPPPPPLFSVLLHLHTENVAPPFSWMKRLHAELKQPILFPSSPCLFCLLFHWLSLILCLFHVAPLFIWLPPSIISRVEDREVHRRETFMCLSSWIMLSCSRKGHKAPSTHSSAARGSWNKAQVLSNLQAC